MRLITQLFTTFLLFISFRSIAATYTMGTSGSQSATVTATSGAPDTFYDDGGSGSNYSSSISGATYTFNCAGGKYIRLKVTTLNFADANDILSVYDGSSTSSRLIGTVNSVTNGYSFMWVATSGSLTFSFTSNGSGVSTGWVCDVYVDDYPGQKWLGGTSSDVTVASNWEGSVIPLAQSSVYFNSTLYTNAPAQSSATTLSVNSFNIASGTFTLSSTTNGIVCYGDVTIDGTFSNTGPYYLYLDGNYASGNSFGGSGTYTTAYLAIGYIQAANIKLSSTATITRMLISNSYSTVVDMNDYNLSVTSTATGTSAFQIPASSTFYQRSGTLSTKSSAPVISGTFTCGTGTTAFNRGGTQTIPSTTYYNFTVSGGAGTQTLGGDITVGNVLTVSLGNTLATGNYNINCAGNFTNSGTFTCGTGTVTFNGTSTVNSGGSNFYNVTLNGTSATLSTNNLAVTGNFTVTAGTFAIGTLTTTVTGASTISGTTTISSGTLDANGSFDATGGTLTFSGAGNLNLGGATVTSLGTFTCSTGTVTFDYAGAQNVPAATYYNLITATSGTKTAQGTVNVGNNLTLNGTSSYDIAATTTTVTGTSDINNTLTISTGTFDANGTFDATGGAVTFSGAGNLYLGGATVTSLGTFTPSTSSVYYDYAGAQTILSTTYYNLYIATSGTKTLGGAIITNGNLQVSAGTLDASGSNYGVSCAGNFTNNGTFTARSGTVTLNGSSAQTLTGTTDPAFYNLTINNSSTGVTLGVSTTCTNTLTLTLGLLKTISYTLTLGTSSANATVSGGSSTAYICAYYNGGTIGYVKHFINLKASTAYFYPIGDLTRYTPFTFTVNNATTLAAGAYFTMYTNASKITGLGASITTYLTRYWRGTDSGISTPDYDISYTYSASDAVAGTEADLMPIKKSGTTWYKPTGSTFTNGTSVGTGSFNSGTRTLSWTGLTSFSDYGGIGPAAVALPIALSKFTGKMIGSENEIRWSTETEIENDYFTLEKTIDGESFEVVGTVKGAGNSMFTNEYFFIDKNIQHLINYYRLVQTDFNGINTFSNFISIDNRGIDFNHKQIISKTNLLGQFVNEDYRGLIIISYSDGSIEKVMK